MKRSINRWTTTIATAALLGLPVAAVAQQPSTPPQQQPAPTEPQQPQPTPAQPTPAQPQPTQPPAQPPTEPQPTQPQPTPTPAPTQPTEPQPTTPPSTTQQPMAGAGQSVSPEEHLRQARAAFEDIKPASIPARNRAEFQQIRRHLAALEKPAAPAASSSTASQREPKGTAAAPNANSWGTEVAAIDRILTSLTGSDTAAGTTGTGTAGATGTAGSTRGAAAVVAVDDATRAKLMEIRTHITAYAAAKSGASSTPRNEAASTTAKDTMTSASQTGNAAAGETPRSGSYATPGSTTGQPPSATAQGTPAESSTTAAQDPAAGAVKVDAEAAHRSLLAARDSLNQLTQLPAAAQLTGEARTQVQQLIAGFNELITNNTDWRTSYAKVAATMSTLLGPENTDAEAAGGAPTATTGATATPGAVGTAGAATIQLDPAVRAKLVEMRNSLNDFQKASGGMSK